MRIITYLLSNFYYCHSMAFWQENTNSTSGILLLNLIILNVMIFHNCVKKVISLVHQIVRAVLVP